MQANAILWICFLFSINKCLHSANISSWSVNSLLIGFKSGISLKTQIAGKQSRSDSFIRPVNPSIYSVVSDCLIFYEAYKAEIEA